MTLDYFYGQTGELFSFYRIPKALFQEQRFQSLSTDAKTLYGILLDRMSLSVKNGWLDKQNRVFIIFTIPVQAQYLSAKGLEQLLQTVQKVRRQINPKLKIEGILLTMTDSRTNYGQQIDNLIRGAYGSRIKVFDQTIPRSVRAAEISAVGKSIFQHDPKGKVAEAYRSLTKEVMANAERQLKRVAERGR